ncbi:MAG TPA: porin family protein [Geothrix sp.]|nr:porin family protein [Geothrix sp.]
MRLRNLLPILALTAAPAFAQDAHFGLQAGISMPQSDAKDFVDSKMGLGLGLNVGIEFTGGHVLRPRLDFTRTKGTLNELGVSFDNTVTTTTLGMDYNYFVSGKATEGFYLIAGLGFAKTKVEASVPGFGSASDSKNALAIALGAGFQFTPMVGADLRYTTTHPDFGGTDKFKNDAINLGVTFRF